MADLEKLLDPELGSEAMDLIHSMSPRSKSCSRQDRNGVHLELRRPWRILHLYSVSTMQNAQAVAGAGRLNVSYEVSVLVAGTCISRDRHSLSVRI